MQGLLKCEISAKRGKEILGKKHAGIRMAYSYIIMAIVSLLVFLYPFGSGDELWNYNFAKNLSLGCLPYRDFNMLQMPLSPCFPALLMALLGRGLIVYRVAGYLLFFLVIALCHHICTVINMDQSLALVITVLETGLLYFAYNYNYNGLMAAVILICYTLTLSKKRRSRHVWLGILAGAAVLIKQNTGLYVFCVNAGISLWGLFQKKEKRANLCRLGFSFLPLFIFTAYLFISRTFGDFMEYAVYGISTVRFKTTPVDLFKSSILYGGILVFGVACMLRVFLKCWKEKADKTGWELFLYGLAGWGVIYPLCDAVHLFVAVIPTIPVYFYFFPPKSLKKWEEKVWIAVSVFLGVFFIGIQLPGKGDFNFYDIPNYECIPMEEAYGNMLDVVDQYVLEKEKEGYHVRIASYASAFFTIPLDRYEKNWDMLLVGNLGFSTVEDLLETEHDNYLYLVQKDEQKLNMQDHQELIQYIKDHYEYYDEVLSFDVYKKVEY